MSGKVSYNCQELQPKDVPRLAAYVGLNSHFGEMTCKEVLAFSDRCQNATSKEAPLSGTVPCISLCCLFTVLVIFPGPKNTRTI